MRFAARLYIDAPLDVVWSMLLDWEGSAAWMVDATTVEVLGAQREGVGTRIRAVTRIAGVPLTDVMEVTRWEERRLIEVEHHRWPIRGTARFEIEPAGSGTEFTWVEDLAPPLGALGRIGGLAVRRPVESVLRKSLRKFRRIAEAV